MSNASSSSSLILLPSNSSSLSCFNHRTAISIAAAFAVTKTFVLLPLCILVLYLGHQRWRQHRSFAIASSSDIFTYCMIFTEFLSVLGWSVFCCGTYINLPSIVLPGYHIMFVVFPGQMLFHCLTCVERYLAVVHPITYRGLRQSSGVWIRNMSIGCVWLLCLGWIGVTALYYPFIPSTPLFCLLLFSLIVVSFCSLSSLCVLIHPRPREVGGNRERLDQSKQRAVVTIMAIMGVLLLYFVGFVVCIALRVAPLLSYSDRCLVIICAIWFSLPSSLLLPLLFLHRAGKLAFCCGNADTRPT